MQIIALGGRGFAGGSRDAALDRYVLRQSGKRRPRVCFVATASGDAAAYVRRVAGAVKRQGGIPSHLSLFAPPPERLTAYLCKHDIVFVGGGNTRNLLALWKLWGLDKAMRKAYERGLVISGVSAGAICWFAAGLTDSWAGTYRELDALGWLRGSFSPHFDSEPRRRPIYRRLIRSGTMPGGYAVDDGVALHFVDGRLTRVVSSRPRAQALEIRRRGQHLIETVLDIQRLA
jgi:peptidase E